MATRNPNVLAKTAVTWIQSEMIRTGGSLEWVKFANIVKKMHILEGWPDQAHNKMKALLRSIVADGLLEEYVGKEKPCSFRVTSKFYAMPSEALGKYIIDKCIPTKSPWQEKSHFKDSSNQKVDVPAWMNSDTFHKKLVEKVALPEVEKKQKKQKEPTPMPVELTPSEITTAKTIVEERIGFPATPPTVASYGGTNDYSTPSTRGAISGGVKNNFSMTRAEIEGIVKASMLGEFEDERKLIKEDMIAAIKHSADEIQQQIIQQVSKSGKLPVVHKIEFNDSALIRSKTRGHTKLKEVVQCLSAGCNVLIIGPDGCGKATIAKHAAKLKEWEFEINAYPTEVYKELQPNTLLCFRNIHQYGPPQIEAMIAMIDGNPKTKFIATILDGVRIHADIRSRFPIARIKVDYDKDIETSLCPDPELLMRMWHAREWVMSAKIAGVPNVFNTAAIKQAYELFAGANWTFEDICRTGLIELTDMQRERAMQKIV